MVGVTTPEPAEAPGGADRADPTFEMLTPPVPQPGDDLMVWNAAFEAVRYSFHHPDVHGGGAIGKATVICLVLGIDAEMTMGELRRRLS